MADVATELLWDLELTEAFEREGVTMVARTITTITKPHPVAVIDFPDLPVFIRIVDYYVPKPMIALDGRLRIYCTTWPERKQDAPTIGAAASIAAREIKRILLQTHPSSGGRP
jgi:hypothetical protein